MLLADFGRRILNEHAVVTSICWTAASAGSHTERVDNDENGSAELEDFYAHPTELRVLPAQTLALHYRNLHARLTRTPVLDDVPQQWSDEDVSEEVILRMRSDSVDVLAMLDALIELGEVTRDDDAFTAFVAAGPIESVIDEREDLHQVLAVRARQQPAWARALRHVWVQGHRAARLPIELRRLVYVLDG